MKVPVLRTFKRLYDLAQKAGEDGEIEVSRHEIRVYQAIGAMLRPPWLGVDERGLRFRWCGTTVRIKD